MYCWSLLSANTAQPPFLLGVTDDLARAQRLTEPHLISGQACLSYIEAVLAAMTVHSLDTCYVRTGRLWIGRRTVGGRVSWQEHDGHPRPQATAAQLWHYRGRAFAFPWGLPMSHPAVAVPNPPVPARGRPASAGS
jgi:hypothetical protein